MWSTDLYRIIATAGFFFQRAPTPTRRATLLLLHSSSAWSHSTVSPCQALPPKSHRFLIGCDAPRSWRIQILPKDLGHGKVLMQLTQVHANLHGIWNTTGKVSTIHNITRKGLGAPEEYYSPPSLNIDTSSSSHNIGEDSAWQ